MTNDIVVRLRNKHADDPLAWEVADEIERLREENKKLMEMKSVEFFQYCKDLWVEKEEADYNNEYFRTHK